VWDYLFTLSFCCPSISWHSSHHPLKEKKTFPSSVIFPLKCVHLTFLPTSADLSRIFLTPIVFPPPFPDSTAAQAGLSFPPADTRGVSTAKPWRGRPRLSSFYSFSPDLRQRVLIRNYSLLCIAFFFKFFFTFRAHRACHLSLRMTPWSRPRSLSSLRRCFPLCSGNAR